MTEPQNDPLADDALLAAFLDTLIPPSDAMPGAGTLGMGSAVRAQVSGNAMLSAPVSAALAGLREAGLERDPGGFAALDLDAREELLKGIMKQHPALGMMQMAVFAGYYQRPETLEALGQPAGAPFPKGNTIEPTDPELLAKLEARKR
ncbi:MAG: gluconate 2-dehydrogenase subunit 3 family protein [Myxococcales bacterium]|nr:gluconate 2-dehydrogenase subunit 3 family protein [Myxococcales bacterium]